MGMEQGGYHLDEGDQGSYDYGGGGDFVYGYGSGESFVIDPGFGMGEEGESVDWGFDTTSWPTLDSVADQSIGLGDDFTYDYGSGLDPVADSFVGFDENQGYFDMGNGYIYDAGSGGVIDTGLQQGFESADSLFGAYVQYYEEMGLDTVTAMELAAQDVQGETVRIETREHELLPDVEQYYALPYVPNYNPWEFQTYNPVFPDLPPPLPPIVTPTLPLVAPPVPQVTKSPVNPYGAVPKAPGLPPACPTGQYHPFPIGHPDQNKCVPFPPAQTGSRPSPTQQQSRSAGGGSSGGGSKSTQPKQQQQPCPTGYTRDPITQQCKPSAAATAGCPTGQYRSQRNGGRCLPIPRCPTGFVFDFGSEVCLRSTANLLPGDGSEDGANIGDSLSELLKNTPPWLWLALLAALALSGGKDEERKRVTVQHRRAA